MVVNIDGCEGRNEDLEGQALVHIRQHAGVEGVKTFDHQDGIFLQFEFIALEDTLTLGEVIGRQGNLCAV